MKKEKEKQLVANIWETPDGTLLWSRYGHDCVFYDDANGDRYMVDGGNDYSRVSVNRQSMINRCVYDSDKWDLQRQYILRGTFDKQGERIWVPLAKLSDKHLSDIIEDDVNYYGRTKSVYTRERNYRKKYKLTVEEHDYTNEKIESIIKPNNV